MIKTLLGQVKQYKKASLLTPFFTALEVLMEVLIPFVTAKIIDKGIEAGNMKNVYCYGILMLVLAAASSLRVCWQGYLPPGLLPALPATCVMECMKTYRPFLFPTLINTVLPVLLPG